MKYIFPLNKLPYDKQRLSGGKASSLAGIIQNTHIRVPEGYVLLSDAFEGFELKKEAEKELDDLVKILDDKTTYAVRSSALNEDGENASFAGQYETKTNVIKADIIEAVKEVACSVNNANVKAYTDSHFSKINSEIPSDNSDNEGSISNVSGENEHGIGIVIQRFINAEFAGVVFTADAITGRDDKMVGNYVHGEGEKLVSGSENAEEFTISTLKFSYEGPKEFEKYSKNLWKYCKEIRKLHGMHMDIEWAVADGKVYILQARPITTLKRLNMDTYDVNGTHSGYKMLTRTNVGEIFMKPVSPMTFSVLEKINEILGLPEWLDNICGQPYMNVSVMCSLLVSFGVKKEKAYKSLKSLVGNVPDGVEIPVSSFDKRNLISHIFKLFFPKEKSRLNKKQKKEMVENLADISRSMIAEIKSIESEEKLLKYWEEVCIPKLRDGMSSVIGQSGTSMVPLFNTRNKIGKIAGEETADKLCGGCLGMVESMKPLFLINDVINGKISKEDYIRECGQRCPNEMELMAVHPYEDENYTDKLIEEHRNDNLDMYKLQEKQQRAYEEALSEFKEKYPSKRKWIDKQISAFVKANKFREDLRSKGVWIFCVFREYNLQAGRLTGLNDDIFMLTFDELFEYLKGNRISQNIINSRRKTYEKYLKYNPFPNIITGRFEAESWMADEHRRYDAFIQNMPNRAFENADIKGFAGASGIVTGKVRVITDIEHIDEVSNGDILVTSATNVGWTPVFTKVSAIITDIGAPLSHAAIVARECGIPAVVGCGNATSLLHTGDTVTVDGSGGSVKILERN